MQINSNSSQLVLRHRTISHLAREAESKVTSDSAAILRNGNADPLATVIGNWLGAMPLALVTGPAATPTYTWITTGNLNEPLLLTNAAGQVTASSTRDPWGNPTLLAGTEPLNLGYSGQWQDPGTNRLAELKDGTGVVSRGFTHTPGGDTATITRPAAPTLTYSYDARGRLNSVLSGTAQIASYAYDWREQRVAASSTEVGARHYLYAENGQLLAEHDAQTGALVREYVWLGTMPLAMVTGPAATPSYTWITTGNLNEPLLLTNAAGQVTASTTRDRYVEADPLGLIR